MIWIAAVGSYCRACLLFMMQDYTRLTRLPQNAIHKYSARAHAVGVFSPIFDTKPIRISASRREVDIGANHERHQWMLHSQNMHTSMNTLE